MYVTRLVLGDEKLVGSMLMTVSRYFGSSGKWRGKSWVDLLETFCQG